MNRRRSSSPRGRDDSWARPRGRARSRSPSRYPSHSRKEEDIAASSQKQSSSATGAVKKLKQNYGLTGALARDAALRLTGDVRYASAANAQKLRNSENEEGEGLQKEPPKPREAKYFEPSDARIPSVPWILYLFEPNSETPKELHLHRKSFYVFGGDDTKSDIFLSGLDPEHAVLQFRQVGDASAVPFLLDLGTTEGTYLNHRAIQASSFVEVRDNDLLTFGKINSTECVLKRSKAT